jgi:hypothetical protein
MTVEMDRAEALCQPKCRRPSPVTRRRFAPIPPVLSLTVIGLPLMDHQPAVASEIQSRAYR